MIHRKEPPYAGTTIAVEKTWAEIERLLMDYGAEAVRRTRLKNGSTTIEFALTTDTGGVTKQFVCQITQPTITRKRRRKVNNQWGRPITTVVNEDDDAAAARLTHWYIKSLLEAAAYGLMSVEKVFMTHIKFQLGDGTTTTAGELMERSMVDGKAPTISGFDHAQPALPEKRQPAQVIEASAEQ